MKHRGLSDRAAGLLAEILDDAAAAVEPKPRAKPSAGRNRSKLAHIGRTRFPTRAEREADAQAPP